MRIASSTMLMSSQHTQLESYTQSEQLQVWIGAAPGASAAAAGDGGQAVVNLSDNAKALLAQQSATQTEATEETGTKVELSDKDKCLIKLIEKFIELWTGKKVKLHTAEDLELNEEKQVDMPEAAAAEQTENTGTDPDWGMRYEYHEMYKEAETVSFNATGSITTKDGQKIDINLTLEMSREYVSEENLLVTAGNAKKVDPLVINFDAATAGLTEAKFDFDLNADGEVEQISFVTSGSGMLALDKNADGVVNDGGELFGPQSGDGFGELAAYDQDGNAWIDEDDPIFEKLRIWTKDETGQDTLIALGQKGIGAIYLGSVGTDYALKSDDDNQEQGQIRETGVFLKETGEAGTIQHVDLAV